MSLNFFFSSLESMTKADEGIQYEGVGAISGGNCAKVALSSEPEVDVQTPRSLGRAARGELLSPPQAFTMRRRRSGVSGSGVGPGSH